MGSELLAGLYDYCPMGAQMGGELLSVLLSSVGEPQTVFTFVQIISIAVCGDTNCVYNLIQGGELLSVAVY